MTSELTLVGWVVIGVVASLWAAWMLVIGWFWASIALWRGVPMANSIMGDMLKQAWIEFTGGPR